MERFGSAFRGCEMSNERWQALMNDQDLELTGEELKEGWHFCPDWDGLLIGPGMMEVDYCLC